MSTNATERARDHAGRWLGSQQGTPVEPVMAAEPQLMKVIVEPITAAEPQAIKVIVEPDTAAQLQSMKVMLEHLMESKAGSGERSTQVAAAGEYEFIAGEEESGKELAIM